MTPPKLSPGDTVMYVSRNLNKGFLPEIMNIPCVVEQVTRDDSYASGYSVKIPLWHDPIDSGYFKIVR